MLYKKCYTFAMSKEVTSAGGIAIDGSRLLLVQHKEGLGFAKGHVDPGETALEAALREFAEETCLHASVSQYLGTVVRQSIEYDKHDKTKWEVVTKIIELFLVKIEGSTGRPYESNTHPVWVEAHHAVGLMKHPEEADFLIAYVLPLINVAPLKDDVA